MGISSKTIQSITITFRESKEKKQRKRLLFMFHTKEKKNQKK